MTHSRPLQTFEEDRLGRESLADYLTTFIETTIPAVNENSFVLALDSPWGTGKTSFIQMWRNKLEESGNKYNFITYNAWENDDCESALIPLICSFSQLDKDVKDGKILSNSIKEGLKIVAPRLLNFSSKLFFNVDTSDLTEMAKELKNVNYPDIIYDSYKSTNEIKSIFRELVHVCTKDNKKLIIFVDELDRCRPTFAIETLEAIKHFFDLENVIFIVSLDMEQLSESVKVVYGNIKTVGYLQRFFDYQILLPSSALTDFLSDRLRYGNITLINEIDYLEKMAEIVPLSLRDLNVICKAYIRFYEKRMKEVTINGIMEDVGLKICLFFISLKYSDTELYLKLIKEGVSLNSIPNGRKLIKDTFGILGDPEALTLCYPPSIVNKKVHELNIYGDKSGRALHSRIFKYVNVARFGKKYNEITVSDALLNIIEYG